MRKHKGTQKPRIIVITDIGNEPDDSESIVRLLVYANEFDIEGIIACTSTWQRSEVHLELVRERISAYQKVVSNLRVHAPGYPSARRLFERSVEGIPLYGMQGTGRGMDTAASQLIIDAVDSPDPRPVWLLLWGGASDLAQALWRIRRERSAKEVAQFVSKLRVYASSDQDDAGPCIRATFPGLFYIVSVHAFGCYGRATFTGISSRRAPGADPAMVSREWLAENIQNKGPLGAVYPTPEYIMEGDSSSILYLVPNGLGSSEHPDWGSWGGRFGSIAPSLGLWADTEDTVEGCDGRSITDNKATIWRWRTAFQNDFLARMIWSVTPAYDQANHNPELVLNDVPGKSPVELRASAGEPIKLSARGSSDPDGNRLSYRWWQYREPTQNLNPPILEISGADTEEATVVAPQATRPAPNVAVPERCEYHVILEVTDDGSPPLKSYRRAVVVVPTSNI
jgi:hypothetical protein